MPKVRSPVSQRIANAAGALHRLARHAPTLAMVLGSGYQALPRSADILEEISFQQIPDFPIPSVDGHPGKALLIRVEKTPVVVFCGRVHFYEGHPMSEVTFAVRVLARLGIRDLLLTNAAGGVHAKWQPGDFMALTDHVNFMGVNPLMGMEDDPKNRFIDLSTVYEPALRRCLHRAARRQSIDLGEGVYLAVAGPSYETPAEIRVFRQWGIDAVGMSTVPESIMARRCGIRVAALSCITNLAAGLSPQPLSHEEVLGVGRSVRQKAAKLLRQFILEYAQDFPKKTDRRGARSA